MDFVRVKSIKRSERKRAFSRMVVALSDIRAAASACDLFIKTVDDLGHDLYYPLLAAIVICYSRPFTANDALGALPSKWSVFSDTRMQDTHHKLVKARDEIIAHSDGDIREVRVVPPGALIAPKGDRQPEMRSPAIGHTVKTYYFPLFFFLLVRDNCTDLIRRLREVVDSEREYLWGGMDLPRAPFKVTTTEGL